ncbi:MAG TPA: undecaprenyl-diphosphatase [Gammaproteobacteria bacterium]|nr:undecaprenyl-diphosphatase [Gammaproteobacteria bacterium]
METLQHLNYQLFNFINAGNGLQGFALTLSIIVAKYLVYLIPLWLVVLWFFAAPKYRGTLLFAVIAAVLSLIVNYFIGLLWFQPRPFMVPIGHTYLTHAPDSAFPSNHVTFIWAIGFSLLLQSGLRGPGSIMLLIALAVGWARVFLGVHFPLDVLGGLVVATIVVLIISPLKPLINRTILPVADAISRKIFPPRKTMHFKNYR